MDKHLAPDLRVAMSDLLQGPVELEIRVPAAALALEDPDFQFPGEVTGRVRYDLVEKRVYSKGTLGTEIETPCARCLEPVRQRIEAPVEVLYEHNADLLKPEAQFAGGDEAAITYYNGETVWPGEDLREAIMVELPQSVLCRADCKGLCPTCGANRNSEPCSCAATGGDEAGWKSALRNLKLGQ